MRVLILGASGLVGRELVGMLSKKTGVQPIAAVRRPDASYAAAGIETRICDAVSAPSVEQAIAGTSHVVNCVLGPADTMLAATRNVAEASLRHGVARVVHFSSIAVFGTRSGEVGEDAPQGEGADWYGRAKIECETIVRDAGRRGLSSVILRPACVYGPGSDLWTGRIGRLLAARRLGDLGPGGEGTCNLVHVRDVAAAAVAALTSPPEAGSAFNLSDPSPVTWNRYLTDFARELGIVPAPRIPGWRLTLERTLAAPPLKIAQILAAKAGRKSLFGTRVPDPITPGLSRLFGQTVRYDSGRADAGLGFPRTAYAEGVAEAARWFKGTAKDTARA